MIKLSSLQALEDGGRYRGNMQSTLFFKSSTSMTIEAAFSGCADLGVVPPWRASTCRTRVLHISFRSSCVSKSLTAELPVSFDVLVSLGPLELLHFPTQFAIYPLWG